MCVLVHLACLCGAEIFPMSGRVFLARIIMIGLVKATDELCKNPSGVTSGSTGELLPTATAGERDMEGFFSELRPGTKTTPAPLPPRRWRLPFEPFRVSIPLGAITPFPAACSASGRANVSDNISIFVQNLPIRLLGQA
ncbi:hypothetical protein LZ30DRAFT_776002 [Colletotrichum cereale]|nr:hypothetical protein LZ30DRAFT_776002 [Colletotrichum cereale]